MAMKTQVISVRLTEEQYRFFSDWQKTIEQELGMDVPMGAVIRRALDGFIQFSSRRQEEAGVQGPQTGKAGHSSPERRSAVENFIKNYEEDK